MMIPTMAQEEEATKTPPTILMAQAEAATTAQERTKTPTRTMA